MYINKYTFLINVYNSYNEYYIYLHIKYEHTVLYATITVLYCRSFINSLYRSYGWFTNALINTSSKMF